MNIVNFYQIITHPIYDYMGVYATLKCRDELCLLEVID